jgi:hypothetical protein
MHLLPILIILIFFIIYYCHTNKDVDTIDINKYKINIKNPENVEDKYNIKNYGLINENIIIHNKYKKELEGLIRNKYITDKIKEKQKQDLLEERNKKIVHNSKKLRNYELKKKINLLKDNINSLKLTFKLELNDFLNDKKQKLITNNDLNEIILKLEKDIKENENKIISTIKTIKQNNDTNSDIYSEYISLTEEYINLVKIKISIIQKKLKIYIKFKAY